jgi:hypothetical protein
MKLLQAVIFSILIVGCSSESKQLKIIQDHCLNKMNGTEKFCNCMTDKSSKNLSEKQLNFMVAGFSGDKQKAQEIRQQMSMDEINRMGDFMSVAIASCSVK